MTLTLLARMSYQFGNTHGSTLANHHRIILGDADADRLAGGLYPLEDKIIDLGGYKMPASIRFMPQPASVPPIGGTG